MSKETYSVHGAFKDLRERAGLSLDHLARMMGYAGASSIQRYESPELSKKALSFDLVAKLEKAVVGKGSPAITADEVWALARPDLREGRKRPLVSSFSPEDAEEYDSGERGYSREGWVPVTPGALPELDGKLGAGPGSLGETINIATGAESVSGHKVVAEWVIPIDYLRNEAKASPAHTIIMEVVGDSMLPTYLPGDRVLIDLMQNYMQSDTVYAISDGQSEPQIKRLQRVPFSDPEQVRIISDNKALETFTADLSRLTIIGRICGHIARK